MKSIRAIIFLFAIIAQSGSLFAEGGAAPDNATVNGYIRDKETGETLVGASIQLKETRQGTITNKSGFYSLSDIKPGTYTVVFSYIGYDKLEMSIELKKRESRRIDVELKSEAFKLEEVVVEGERFDDRRQITVSRVNIPIRQINQLRIGGEADVFRSIQFLPGVLASSQISSGLYIRGGSPDQTLVLIDGSTVYNPTHLFGFFSTFNPDAVKDVDLIKGGYPAEYGGRLSAVLDLVQKDGNRKELHGTASLGLIATRLSGEGPLGNGSWFLGGRRTYIDLLTNLIETDEDPLPNYYFYDLNGKVSQDFGLSDKVFLSGFTSEDRMEFDNRAGFNGLLGISNRAVSTRWTHLFSDNLFSVFNFSWSRYRNSFETENAGFETMVENVIQDFTLKGNLEWFTSPEWTMKGGFEVNRYVLQYLQNFSGDADSTAPSGSTDGGIVNLDETDHTASMFVQSNYQFSNLLSLQSGLRVNYYDLRNIVKLDPRLALRYQWNESIAVKAAWGIYHQYFRLASLPDFSFFDTWLPTDSTVQPSMAIHYVLGVETQPFDGIDFNIDAYYKELYHVSELNQFQTRGRTVQDYFYDGEGEAFGVEFFLQKKTGRLTGWAGYALGWINTRFDELNGGRYFRPKWDRRHDVKIVGQYRLNDRWDFSATFTLQSGQSYTGRTSRLESRLPGSDFGKGITVPAERFGLRLPMSHQLNLNATYHTTLFGLPTKVLIDIYNVYSRRDIWFRYYDTTGDVTKVEDVTLLPILPSVAVEINF
ncbi:MAG TPA: TonB-dependent receptor [Bacteroidota bacterium]|nr:TonB-dependent receptor [Bacteroidota bacterium]